MLYMGLPLTRPLYRFWQSLNICPEEFTESVSFGGPLTIVVFFGSRLLCLLESRLDTEPFAHTAWSVCLSAPGEEYHKLEM